uniref:Synaptotagmin-like 2a n=1 Tax=Cyclopterus lumpus TaxID=8103 RepID=A0A8C2YZP1_CYCLU
MIDLSFLTEEEQETIRTVLKRDAKLKKAEEQRVQNLQKTVSDEGRLKYMTGEWFYETKQLRHQDRIHGSEIIRASMRHSYKPLTILELSQILPEKPSFVSSENKEVFVPPALSGILQQPHTQLKPLPSSDSCISYASNLKQEPNDSPITQNASMPMPMPVNISSSHDSFVEEDRPGGQQTNSTAPRGILKHLSTSSNTDSLFSCLDLQSPVSLDSPTPTESWIDRKQVRFSSKAGQSGVEWQDGMELGENGLLDVNPITPSEAENNNDLEDTGRAPVGIRGPVFNQSKVDSQEGELNGKYESNLQEQEDESDSTLETNLGWRRNTGSSTSNLSLSSGLASISSVSGSISSLYFGDIEVQGSIQLAVNYIQKLGEFHIFVVHCRDLAVADMKNNCSDPYVKCYLLSEKTKLGKRKTTVKKKTLNPTYNEILRFKIIMEVLKTQSLNISVWQNNTFGRNSFLGEVDLDMSEWDFSNTHINEYALKRTSRMETGEVQIWVKDCKNLPPVRGVFIDPFVKCTVLPDTSRKSRQKTRVVKRTANPMFNHTMVYDGFRSEDLREACVEITVWDHDRLSSHYIGGLRLGLGTGKSYGVEVAWMDSTTDEAHLWQRMLQSDGEWVEDALPLRTLVMAKSMSK